MKINRLLVVSAASVLIGGGSFALTNKALADQFTLMAQNSSPPTEQREEGEGRRSGSKFERLTGITDAQKTQLRQIRSASHQQIDAILTAEQKAQMQAIRTEARSKMDAVLTAQQRQQLQELRQQRQQDRQQQQP
jgi:Spy/CpxP family protein refolding chaperone